MEWVETLSKSIDYMENHLLEEVTVEDIAKHVHISPFYFQKGFKLITGYTIGEYIRNRRLYLAALEVIKGENRIIDLAYKYGYDTPESFTKAFSRFHGASPMQIKGQAHKINLFHPLQISITIKGGRGMEYRIEALEAFQVIGIEKTFRYDSAFANIPKFWDEYCHLHIQKYGYVLEMCCIGMYGISIEEEMNYKDFSYLIAGTYQGESVPKGLKVVQIPALTWAKFRCVGPMPEAIQALNTKIFNEWLPGNSHYEIAAGYNIEFYSEGDTRATDYMSEIWIPVKEKEK